MNINNETLVSYIVADNYKTAEIFKAYGIDFCCNGNRTIEKVCETNNVDIEILIDKIAEAYKEESIPEEYQSWDIDFLSDYIYNKHHKYIENKVPEIKEYLIKLCQVHGTFHPELLEIFNLFSASSEDLIVHMKKEELILFPYFKKLAEANRNKSLLSNNGVKSIKNPITMMHQDHDNEGKRFRYISELSNGYSPPIDACNTYKVTYSLLQEFEDDLHKHIHLENNILFKKAIELEQKLNKN